jgi:hypothetical protein
MVEWMVEGRLVETENELSLDDVVSRGEVEVDDSSGSLEPTGASQPTGGGH